MILNIARSKKVPLKEAYKIMKTMMAMKLAKEDSTPGQVLDNVFIGSVGAAYTEESLNKHGITHIVTVASKIQPRFKEKFTYKIVDVIDKSDCDIMSHFKETNAYIEEVLADEKHKVLIHCFAGKSRACSFTAAYLMGKKRMSLEDALTKIKSVR